MSDGILENIVTELVHELNLIDEKKNEDLSDHPLMREPAQPLEEQKEGAGRREF